MVKGRDDETDTPANSDAEARETPGAEDAEADRAAILKRRAMFVASAIASIGIASCSDTAEPQPCLEFEIPPPPSAASSSPQPQPCLDVTPPPQPCLSPQPCLDMAIPEEQTDAGTGDAGTPQPCLRFAPPPQPCLKVAPPKK